MSYKQAYEATKAAIERNFEQARATYLKIKDPELKTEVHGLLRLLESGKCQPEIASIIETSYAKEMLKEEINSIKKEMTGLREIVNYLVQVVMNSEIDDEEEVEIEMPLEEYMLIRWGGN